LYCTASQDPKSEIAALKTEIKRLRHRETLFYAMQKLVDIGYCEQDCKNGCISTCTLGFAKIFNTRIEEVLESQQDWDKALDVVHPADRGTTRIPTRNPPIRARMRSSIVSYRS